MATPNTTTDTPLKVLISGAGIAGPCLAWFLTNSSNPTPIHVTIVERAPGLRSAGQNIDIRGKAIDVVNRMGLLPAIRALNTTEKGMSFVDRKNKAKATFAVDKNSSMSPTSEFEIVRADLCKLFHDESVKVGGERIKYIFDDSIKAITEPEGADKFVEGAFVEFTNGSPAGHFDLIVGADGLGSKVRRLVWPEAGTDVVHSLKMIMSFFTVPRGPTDTAYARWYNAPGRRVCLVRPDNCGTTRALFSVMKDDPRLYESLERGTGISHEKIVQKQKALLTEYFADAGWETERLIDGMNKADDFYMSEVAQIKMGEFGWSRGHVTLLGDAGYCPSPISGQGTALSIIGSYILAGEIIRHGKDVKGALPAYETAMRPIVDKAQKLFGGGPALVNPESKFGIAVLHGVVKLVSSLKLIKLFEAGGDAKEQEKVPDYKGLPQAVAAA